MSLIFSKIQLIKKINFQYERMHLLQKNIFDAEATVRRFVLPIVNTGSATVASRDHFINSILAPILIVFN